MRERASNTEMTFTTQKMYTHIQHMLARTNHAHTRHPPFDEHTQAAKAGPYTAGRARRPAAGSPSRAMAHSTHCTSSGAAWAAYDGCAKRSAAAASSGGEAAPAVAKAWHGAVDDCVGTPQSHKSLRNNSPVTSPLFGSLKLLLEGPQWVHGCRFFTNEFPGSRRCGIIGRHSSLPKRDKTACHLLIKLARTGQNWTLLSQICRK